MLKVLRTFFAAALMALPAMALAGGVITEGYSASPTSNTVQKTTKSQEQQVYLFAALLLNGHAKAVDDEDEPEGNPAVVVANIIDDPETSAQVGCSQAPVSSLLAALTPWLLVVLRRRRPGLRRSE